MESKEVMDGFKRVRTMTSGLVYGMNMEGRYGDVASHDEMLYLTVNLLKESSKE